MSRIESGKIAQINGTKYENSLITSFQSKDDKYEQIVNYICKEYKIDKSTHSFYLYKPEEQGVKKKVNSVLTKKTTSKADLILNIISNSSKKVTKIGVSVKMAPLGIQVQICPLSNFLEYSKKFLKINEEEYSDLETGFKKFFGLPNYTPQSIESDSKILSLQQERINKNIRNADKKMHQKYYFYELSEKEQSAINNFIKKNIKEILEFIYKKGFCELTEHHADLLIKNKCSYTEKGIIDFEIIKIDTYIEHLIQSINNLDSFGSKHGNIKLGSLKLQMKGSGTGASYNSMQFKE